MALRLVRAAGRVVVFAGVVAGAAGAGYAQTLREAAGADRIADCAHHDEQASSVPHDAPPDRPPGTLARVSLDAFGDVHFSRFSMRLPALVPECGVPPKTTVVKTR